jgi:PKHD-type hydroxylase|tara:strand:+ start:1565 stop:2125 length:561 start_codon:yes stop_codon:yes gene_type:complete
MFYEPSQKQWLFITDVFTPEECETISKYSESLQTTNGATTGKQQQQTRSSTIAWMPRDTENQWIYQRLLQTIELTNPNTFQFEGLQIGEPVQVSQYVEDDFYDWHIDAVEFPNSPPVRKVSCSVMLTGSTEFTGGELQIRAWNEETIKLEQGQGLFFASFLQHRVLPVTAGMRRSMVIWYNGPAFK